MNEIDIKGIGMTSQRTRDRLVERLQNKGIQHPEVLRVMRLVPRHLFVDEAMASRSYEDSALPIGHGQTISQPYTVARMTELLLESAEQGSFTLDKVLEVGTGSGYQAAVLGGLVKELHTVEVITTLYRNSRDILYKLGFRNIRTHIGDGSWGWPDAAPYDGILVTAAPEEVPEALLLQVKVGGSIIIPIGPKQDTQVLQQIIRHTETKFETIEHESVVFVPLVAGQ